MSRPPVRPDRVRCVRRGFAAVPNRFLHEGFFAQLSHVERSLYFFLLLAGDRQGVSYYGYDRICSTLGITPESFIEARNALVALDLIATDGTRFQVLSLPDKPLPRTASPLLNRDDFERDDPATIRQLIRASLGKG